MQLTIQPIAQCDTPDECAGQRAYTHGVQVARETIKPGGVVYSRVMCCQVHGYDADSIPGRLFFLGYDLMADKLGPVCDVRTGVVLYLKNGGN